MEWNVARLLWIGNKKWNPDHTCSVFKLLKSDLVERIIRYINRDLEEQATLLLLASEKARGTTKLCPFCGSENNKDEACNYVTCYLVWNDTRINNIKNAVLRKFQQDLIKNNPNNLPLDHFKEQIEQMQLVELNNAVKCPGGFNGKSEWCWICCKPKYQPDPKNVGLGCCNDQTHNSH